MRRILGLLVILLAVVLIERAAHNKRGVLLTNQGFGERFLALQDPYLDTEAGHRVHGPYPPSYALVCAPLSLIPTPIARRVWALAQIGALVILYRILRERTREFAPELLPKFPVMYALALLLVSRFLLRDMHGGGGNLLYATLAVLGLDASLRGHALRAAFPIALGLVVKPSLAPLLLFFVLRRKWKTLGATLAAASLLFFLPAAWFGFDAYLHLAIRWASDVLQFLQIEKLHDPTLVPDGLPQALAGMNQSLRESVFRLLRPPSEATAFDVHVIDASPAVATLVSRTLVLFFVGGTSWVAVRARGGFGEWFSGLAFLSLSLLTMPVVWKAHHVVLLPVFFVLVTIAFDKEARPRWLIPGLVAYYLVCDLSNFEILGEAASDWLQAIGVVTAANGLILIATWKLITKQHEQD